MTDAEKDLQTFIQNVAGTYGEKRSSKSKIYRRQWLTSLYFCLPLIITGMSFGHSTILVEELKPSNTTRSLKIENGELFGKPTIVVESLNTQSWIVSIIMLCKFPGCLALAILSQQLGRKKTLMISMGLYFISLIIQMLANDVSQILIGRGLFGFSSGIVAGITAVYQGECAIPKLRATLNVMQGSAVALGIELSHALGIWFHWRTNVLFASLIAATVLILCCTVVESPIWLLQKKKFREAVESWTFWRGTDDLDELLSMHSEKLNLVPQHNRKKLGVNDFCGPSFLKPLGIIMAFFTVTQSSGVSAVTNYSKQMINAIAGKDRAYAPLLILDTFRLVSSLTSTFFTKKFGPRAVSLGSAFSTAFFLITLSLVMLLNLWSSWIALTLLFFYEAAVITGLVAIPWSYCSELFSTSHKEIGIGVATSYNFILIFIVLKLNPFLTLELGQWGVFLLYGLCTTIGSVVLYLILPDTRNKSLREIELMFSKD